jgi:hypothetical protein
MVLKIKNKKKNKLNTFKNSHTQYKNQDYQNYFKIQNNLFADKFVKKRLGPIPTNFNKV